MTEAEWLAGTDPGPLLKFLGDEASHRKLRLFACACCRRVWHMLEDGGVHRRMVEVAERYADGLASTKTLAKARRGPYFSDLQSDDGGEDCAESAAEKAAARKLTVAVAEGAAHQAALAQRFAFLRGYDKAAGDPEPGVRIEQSALLRDLFGNPFRPVTLDHAWLAWNDGTVRKLAQAVYDERRFADLPLVADALEDAGCTDADLLGHLRRPGPHVRGCWAVDLILHKK